MVPEMHRLGAQAEQPQKAAKRLTRCATEVHDEVTTPGASAAVASPVPQFPFPLLKQASGPLTVTRCTSVKTS